MNWLLFIAGAIIMVWSVIEALWTTLWIDGSAAPLTTRLTTGIWKAWRAFFKQKQHRALSLAGPMVLFLTVSSWIVFIWLGWSMMFYAREGSLASSEGKLPDLVGTLWYVAYTMFTVGNGDFKPQSSVWQFLSAFVAFSGMGLVTLSITYIMQIISAVVTKRSFAGQVNSIARAADDFVAAQWTGNGFSAIELQLNALSGQLATLNEQHLAYPILHYYHANKADKSSAVALPVLDDALTILTACVPEQYRPASTILNSCRASVTSYLQTLKAAHIHAKEQAPPLPDWEKLNNTGMPLCSKAAFVQVFNKHSDRRKLLFGLTENAAWQWYSNLEKNE